jgi:uncharacterized protein (TIGR00255 family)
MTGFGARQGRIKNLGKLYVEIKSSNHKFLDIVLHLPQGFLALEDKIKKEIEAKLKRGRVNCDINISDGLTQHVIINKRLLKNYLNSFKDLRQELKIKNEPAIDTLINLPGVVALSEEKPMAEKIWPLLRNLLNLALAELVKARKKEGGALQAYLAKEITSLFKGLETIEARFKKVIKEKSIKIISDEERSLFLKAVDITEEIERLLFHIKNFNQKLNKGVAVGKELDFIAQEMQREANTLAAKSADVHISARIVNIKSQIEKIREQLQNIE